MSMLRIQSHERLGPLDVTVHRPGGEDIDFALSSGHTEHSIDVEDGLYAVVARRPNGEQLRQTVTVAGETVQVRLGEQVPPTPNEFMAAETERGQIRPAPTYKARIGLSPGILLAGAAGRGLANAVSASLSAGALAGGGVLASLGSAGNFEAVLAEGIESLATRTRQRTLRLRLWRLGDRRWAPLETSADWRANRSADFFKMRLEPDRQTRAVGLIDGRGLGPIVMVPPFNRPVEVSFIADGVLARSVDRNAVPGGQRTPVALVHVEPPAAADMLAALAASGTPRAGELWEQTASQLAGSRPDDAIEMLLGKFQQPAEALLAAHFLVRFMPQRLPTAWAENLARALPDAADGPVLAAWSWINNPPAAASGEAINDAVDRWIGEALRRPAVLFARTRALLFDALDLCREDTATRGRAEQLPYRRAGAAAGGFECYWGGAPASPGRPVRVSGGEALAELAFDRGAFLS